MAYYWIIHPLISVSFSYYVGQYNVSYKRGGTIHELVEEAERLVRREGVSITSTAVPGLCKALHDCLMITS